ncbi:MAG: (5-formylfuran-3-yl)methyl phosphate synthase [Aeoliella sp.]
MLASVNNLPCKPEAKLYTAKTQLLVSVRSAREALEAVEGGADWIDVKEPLKGALGRAEPQVVEDIVRVVDGRRPVTAALGELQDLEQIRRVEWDWLSGIAIAKVGLAGCRFRSGWQREITDLGQRLPPATRLVVVHYADAGLCESPPIDQVLAASIQCRSPALLVDTFHKDQGRLLDHLGTQELHRILAATRDLGMVCVVAGSLREIDFRLVLQAGPALVAVRGAVCEGANRESAVCRALVARLRQALSDELARIS